MKRSIRSNTLIIFLLLIGFIVSVLLILQYYFSIKIANKTTEKTFTIIAKNIDAKIIEIQKHIQNNLYANVENPLLYGKIDLEIYHPVLNNFIYIINTNPTISSLYFTNKAHAFYELVNMKKSMKLPKNIAMPAKTKWTVVIYKDGIMQYAFLDTQLHLLKKIRIKEKYDIAQRPWYKRAINSQEPIYTDLYFFKQRDELGFTYALHLKDKYSVFAIDYTLQDLNNLLFKQKFIKKSQIFLFNKRGKIIASSEQHKENSIFNDQNNSLKFIQMRDEQKIIKYHVHGKLYYLIYKKTNKNFYIATQIDANFLLAPFLKNLIYSLIWALFFILLTIPLILYSTNIIIKPIHSLIRENEKIKKRSFDAIEHIDSNIIEFMELSDSLVNMAHSIHTYQKEQKKLLDSIIQLIAKAVDAKSSYTAGHCRRVPEIANILIQAANKTTKGSFKDFIFEEEAQRETFTMAAWLHDCGKVTTPEYVVDKATKLETIYNRIHEIRTRFEVLWRDAEIEYLKATLAKENTKASLKLMHIKQQELLEDFAFIAKINIGKEYMHSDNKKRLKKIAQKVWLRHFDDTLGISQEELKRYESSSKIVPAKEYLLADKQEHIIPRESFDYEQYKKEGFKEDIPRYLYNYGEIYNLCIQRGTLTDEERYKINEHVIITIQMLEKIPFPAELSKVPEYAGQHHEQLNGKGYPKKLTAKELSIPSRILAIADIFEALTAADRPYKKAKTLSEALDIMNNMAKEKHIDRELFRLFVEEKIYLTYAKKYLKKEQINHVNEEKYLKN